MSRFVRSSKYRHVFGTPWKREKCYDNIRITKSPHDSNMCSVNGKFVAVVLESQGGGAFLVAPLTKVCVCVCVGMWGGGDELLGGVCHTNATELFGSNFATRWHGLIRMLRCRLKC